MDDPYQSPKADVEPPVKITPKPRGPENPNAFADMLLFVGLIGAMSFFRTAWRAYESGITNEILMFATLGILSSLLAWRGYRMRK